MIAEYTKEAGKYALKAKNFQKGLWIMKGVKHFETGSNEKARGTQISYLQEAIKSFINN